MDLKKTLHGSFAQAFFVYAAFTLMVAIGGFFVSSIINKSSQAKVAMALEEAEKTIRAYLREPKIAFDNIYVALQDMLDNNETQKTVHDYLTHTTTQLAGQAEGVEGFLGVFGHIRGGFLSGRRPLGYAPNFDPAARPWYVVAENNTEAEYTSSPYIDNNSKEPVLSLSKKLYGKNGDYYGVLGLDIFVSWMMEYVETLQFAEGGHGMILNQDLDILAHPEERHRKARLRRQERTVQGRTVQERTVQERTGQGRSGEEQEKKTLLKELGGGFAEVQDLLTAGQDVSAKHIRTADGKRAIVFFKQMYNGWYIGAVMPSSSYYADLYFSVFVLAALGFVLAAMLSYTLLRLSRAKLRSDEKSLLKSRFLANMSHEIRTPMNAIAGMAELMLREDLPGAARKHALTIRQAGVNLLAIINEILDFSKIESGKLEIVPGDYLFSSLINDVISIIRMRLVESEVRFVANIDCNIPNALYGDEIKIRQIFLNILSNAVKYTEKGHVSLSVRADAGGAEGETILEITVADTGRGIKPEDMEKLFGDFAQVDMAANKGIEGTGLGLSITRSLAKAMGGDISAASQYGSGSTFKVILPQKAKGIQPLAAVENPGEKSALVFEPCEIYADSILRAIEGLGAKAVLASSSASFRDELERGGHAFVFIASAVYGGAREICQAAGKDAKIVLLAGFGEMAAEPGVSVLAMPATCISIANILNGADDPFSYSATGSQTALFAAPEASVLIVDDISTNLSVAQGLLAPYQMNVELCLSGKAAIEAIAAKKYDLVLMDHMMPEMDGIEATAKIRALGGSYYANLPIVALTANAVSGAREMFLQNGFNDFLAKPINTAKLNSMLEKWLPKAKQSKIDPKGIAAQPPPAQGAAPGLIIEGLDTKVGQARSGGELENYLQTLAIFMKDGQNKIGQIKKCLEAADLPLYVTYVHALKSASANVGAAGLSESAGALEAAGARGDLAYMQSHTANMLHTLETVLGNIGAAIAAKAPMGQEGATGAADMAQIKAELAKLAEAIDRLDARAISEAVKALRTFADAPGIGASIEKILQNTLIGEYDEAAAEISAMLYQFRVTRYELRDED